VSTITSSPGGEVAREPRSELEDVPSITPATPTTLEPFTPSGGSIMPPPRRHWSELLADVEAGKLSLSEAKRMDTQGRVDWDYDEHVIAP
jgi:hypothetical protein